MNTIHNQITLLSKFQDNVKGAITPAHERNVIVSCVHLRPDGNPGENIISPEAPTVVPLTIKAMEGQSAHLTNWCDPEMKTVSGVNSDGKFIGDGSLLNPASPTTKGVVSTPTAGGLLNTRGVIGINVDQETIEIKNNKLQTKGLTGTFTGTPKSVTIVNGLITAWE